MSTRRFAAWVALLILVLHGPLLRGAPAAAPEVVSITLEGTNVLVKVAVPAGVRKVTLESRSRLDGSSWQPRALQRFETKTTEAVEITFTVPRGENLEVLRLRTDETEAVPSGFFKGTNQFNGNVTSSSLTPGANFQGMDGTASPPAPTESRSVVESDIWRIAGDTLYFFNNLRGLQIVDIADPEAPVVKGTYPISAAGEQMYVLPSGEAVLLTRNWCSYGAGGDQAHVLVIDPAEGNPRLAADVGVPGTIFESRMVGKALYLVSQYYGLKPTPQGPTWESTTVLTSIDLADPAAPVQRSSVNLNGYSGMATATDRYLFSITHGSAGGSDVQIVDISAPNGEFEMMSTLRLSGRVADKFKLNMDGDVLTVISANNNLNGRWSTVLENYSLADARSPVRLGSVRLAEGEQLYATRFDGKRAYIVTYLRIDPLWIVDLSDPARPAITGELHVPGWSTYLHPMGDRLLALGVDDTNSWRVAVSLFDVSNTRAPALLSKVVLGESSSWSEAQSDEKAFTVLANAGLTLVPWQTYTPNGYVSHVQLIDLGRDALTARGRISDHFNPRRASLHRGHILSVSGRELTSHDAANRDAPVLKGRVDLAWPVNEVRLAGEYLIEFDSGASYWGWNSVAAPAVMRVARANAPDRILSSVTFTNGLPISGVEIRGGKLYVAQAQQQQWGWVVITETDGNAREKAGFRLSVWDLGGLPALNKIGETALESGPVGNVNALWPKPNLLVWSGGSGSMGWGWGWGMPFMAMDAMWSPWFWGGSAGGRLAAFDVTEASAPVFKSQVDISTNGWSFTKGIVAEGLIYLSHQQNETVEVPPEDPVAPPAPAGSGWGGEGSPRVRFVTRHFLDVVDFADASSPVVRKPVNIPGALQGVSHQGGIVYTMAPHFSAEGQSDFTDWLDASAYDGVAAYLVASLNLPNWPHPIVVNGPDLFIGRTAGLERWRLSDDGMLQKLSTTVTSEPVNGIRFFGNLAALAENSKWQLFDAGNRGELRLVGESALGCNWGANLETSDGELGRGLWIPQNDYGVLMIPASP